MRQNAQRILSLDHLQERKQRIERSPQPVEELEEVQIGETRSLPSRFCVQKQKVRRLLLDLRP